MTVGRNWLGQKRVKCDKCGTSEPLWSATLTGSSWMVQDTGHKCGRKCREMGVSTVFR